MSVYIKNKSKLRVLSNKRFPELQLSVVGESQNDTETQPVKLKSIEGYTKDDFKDFIRKHAPGKDGKERKVDKDGIPTIFVDDYVIERNFPRYAHFLDCSIWNYRLVLRDPDFKTKFDAIIKEIEDNYAEGRYKLAVASEYAEFYKRLSLNSYLDDVGGHAGEVSPFLFHSELLTKYQLFQDGVETICHNLHWRLLLVDDHPNEDYPMESTNEIRVGKLDILKNDLRRIGLTFLFQDFEGKILKESNDYYIEFDFARTVDGAYEKIKNNKYDIILLDYKLDKDEKGRQEYGYELLERIRDDQEGENAKKELKPGPNETFYFMFISAYTTAVQERLQAEGFYVSKDYWFIGRGACPTNTPYLFLYSLKRMMDIRYDKLTKHSKQLLKDLAKGSGNVDDKTIEGEKGKYATMTMFLTKLYEEGKERNNCVIGFNAFLNLRRVYDVIKHDVDHDKNLSKDKQYKRSSPLIMSLFKDEEFCSNSFWEHLQNLVYLTAFGTIRQWPEMWEDYNFIKMKLVKAEDKIWEGLSEDEKKKNTKPSILIREYILSLKGMMS